MYRISITLNDNIIERFLCEDLTPETVFIAAGRNSLLRKTDLIDFDQKYLRNCRLFFWDDNNESYNFQYEQYQIFVNKE